MPTFALRTAATLALALAAALACVRLGTPIPWMIGPLLATSLASIAGAPTASWPPLRNAGQWVIGAALGLYFTPQVTALVAGLWWAILVAVAWALALGWGFGCWLHRRHAHRMGGDARAQRATSYFAGAIGGASEMTLLAEREGARSDLVAAAHSMRLVLVTLVIPFAFGFLGVQGLELFAPAAAQVTPAGLALLAVATAVGSWALQRTGRANPWFMGSLLVTMGFTMAGVQLSAMPVALSNAAQLVIGVSLGVRFRREFLQAAPRWLLDVAGGTVALGVLSAGFAGLLAGATGLPVATLVLGTSPGGIAEMAITAKVLQLGVPVVTAFQVCRLVAVLVLVEPLYRRAVPRRGGGPGGGLVSG